MSSSDIHWQECPLFDVVHSAFPLPTTVSPTLQGVLKDGFGEAVVVCGMPEPCKFPSPDSCQKRFLWTRKEVDLARHPVIGLVLQVGDALGFESLDPFVRVSKEGPCFTAIDEVGGDKRRADRLASKPTNMYCASQKIRNGGELEHTQSHGHAKERFLGKQWSVAYLERMR